MKGLASLSTKISVPIAFYHWEENLIYPDEHSSPGKNDIILTYMYFHFWKYAEYQWVSEATII